MTRRTRIVSLGMALFLGCCLCATKAPAQSQKLPADLTALPDEIKTLQWQTIDLATVQPLEQARSLLLMDHVLSELSSNATAEADLMSAYLEKNKLGPDFANSPPAPPTKQLNFTDGQKVAIAMLRGPMRSSYYATELGDVAPTTLSSYAEMYQRTCQRKWSEFDEARHQVRAMSWYLGNAQKLADYDTWATAESTLRQKQYEQQNPTAAAPAAPSNQPQTQALQQQNQQLTQALGAAEYQQQAQSQQLAQAQQQTADAQQQTAQAQQQQQSSQQSGSPTYVAAVPAYGTGVYGGYGAYAGAYAGATAATGANAANAANAAANANTDTQHVGGASEQQKEKAAAAGSYHASNNTWNKDASYNSAAHSQTEQRMSSFHGAPAGGGGSRGGRR